MAPKAVTAVHGYNGIWVHNMLNNPEALKTTDLGGWHRSFEIEAEGVVKEGDIVLKWSEDGVNKTIWKVIEVKEKEPYPNKTVKGEMVDLIAQKRVTKRIARAVRKADKDFCDG